MTIGGYQIYLTYKENDALYLGGLNDDTTYIIETIIRGSTANNFLCRINSNFVCIIDKRYLFDSHSRDRSGKQSPEGTAVLLEFSNLDALCKHIFGGSRQQNEQLDIYPIYFVHKTKVGLEFEIV